MPDVSVSATRSMHGLQSLLVMLLLKPKLGCRQAHAYALQQRLAAVACNSVLLELQDAPVRECSPLLSPCLAECAITLVSVKWRG